MVVYGILKIINNVHFNKNSKENYSFVSYTKLLYKNPKKYDFYVLSSYASRLRHYLVVNEIGRECYCESKSGQNVGSRSNPTLQFYSL